MSWTYAATGPRHSPRSGPSSAKASHEKDDQGDDKDQPECAAAEGGTTDVKATAAEEDEEHYE